MHYVFLLRHCSALCEDSDEKGDVCKRCGELFGGRTLMVLPIAELTNDELHGPLGSDEGAVAQGAVATDAIRPTHATHIRTVRASTGTQKHAISIGNQLTRALQRTVFITSLRGSTMFCLTD